MPINPMYFQILSPQQANGFGVGLQQGTNVVGQSLQNQLMAAQAPYAGQMAQAQLANTQSQAPYMQSQTALNQAYLPYAGYKFLGPMMGAMMQAQRNAIQSANMMRAYVQTPDGQNRLANDPTFHQQYIDTMNNAARFSSMGTGFNMPMPGMPGQPNNTNQQPTWMPSPQMPSGSSAQPNNQQPNGSVNPAGVPSAAPNYQTLPITPAQIQKLQQLQKQGQPLNSQQQNAVNMQTGQQVAQNQSTLQNLTKDQEKRLSAGQRFNTTSQQLIKDFDNGGGSYFSPQGQAQLRIDQLTAAKTGKIPPNLQAYRNLMQDIQQANLQGAMLEGVPSDQISRGDYNEMFEPSKLANTPAGARAQLVNTVNLGLKADNANKMTMGQVKQQPDTLYPVAAPAQGNTNAQMVMIQGKDGRKWNIPANQLNTALQRGAKQING